MVQRTIYLVLGCFNSIKVQLELCVCGGAAIGALFQFHKGAIRTRSVRGFIILMTSFNSIKVQLEHGSTELRSIVAL